MYPYHNTIKKRIKNGELIGYNYVNNYNGIGECMLLFFSTPPFIRPIRPYKYIEYIDILESWQQDKQKKSDKAD